jgi:hypothetical protein
MQLTIHPKEWMQYTSQSQSIVQSHRDHDGVGTSIVLNQL